VKDKEYLLIMVNLWNKFSKHDFNTSLEPEKFDPLNDLPTVDVTPEPEQPKIETDFIISQELEVVKGADLEKATELLFRELFQPFDIKKLRRQKSGEQFGFDIELECHSKQNSIFEYKIECKNYQKSELSVKDIAPKIDQLRYEHNNKFEHFIIISPICIPANTLNRRIKIWNDDPTIHFETQIWSPNEHVENFFGLQPDIYDKFYKTDLEKHPKNWSSDYRSKVIEKYKELLLPRIRLSQAWREYLKNSLQDMLLGKEASLNYPELYGKYVDLKATNVHGKKFSLIEHVCSWLDNSSEKTMIVLGEFGSGKTFFTYCLSQKLAEKYRNDPKANWIPLRLSLQDYAKDAIQDPETFLKRRLDKLGIEQKTFNNLVVNKNKIFIILDGFDEMSKKIDDATVSENSDKLITCYDELKRDSPNTIKFLITSRKGFFYENKHKKAIMKRLGNPQVMELEDIPRKEAFKHLVKSAKTHDAEEKVKKLQYVHDPIGLATKPLFLSMLEEIVNDLDETCSNVAGVYNKFIDKSLRRKFIDTLEKTKKDDEDEIVYNMVKILQDISVELRKSKSDFISLSKFLTGPRKPAASLLWELTDSNEVANANEDAENRIFHRSLLVRSSNSDENSKNVEFCHRSMGEFFVAKAVCNMLINFDTNCLDFLKECDLNDEIVYFVSQLVDSNSKQTGNKEEIKNNLLICLNKTKNKQTDDKYSRLGRNAINILHKIFEPLPSNDYSNMALDEANLQGADLSDKNFSGTSLRKANLYNVSFKDADFRKSDLTGALFDETFKIVAITHYDKHIYALYDDNSIWKWDIQTKQAKKIISDTYGILSSFAHERHTASFFFEFPTIRMKPTTAGR